MIDPKAFDLTTEQEFLLRTAELSSRDLPEDHVKDLLLQASRLLMVKDNVIKHLMEKQCQHSLNR